MDGDAKRLLSGAWIPVLGIIAYSAGNSLSLSLWQRFGFPSDRPGDSPPWYFIRQDYIEGIVMGGIGLLCILIGVLALRRFRLFAGMLVWQTLIWFGHSAWQALVIVLRSDHVMEPSAASTAWPSFDAYIADPLLWPGQIAIYLLAALVCFATVASPSAWSGLPRVGKPAYEPRDH
jgi:hypothetical protein